MAFEDDSPELIFEQNQPSLEIEISGSMSYYVYDQHGRHLIHHTFDDSVTHHALSKSRYDPYIVSIKLHSGEVIKVDLQNLDDDVRINGLVLPDLPTANVDYYPSPTPEDVLQSFQESPLGTLEFFPIAQDPWETEIYQFADQHSRYDTPENRHPGTDFFAPAGTEVISSSDGEVIGIYIPSRTDFEYDAYGTADETLKGAGILIEPRQLYPDIPAGNTTHRKNTVSGMLTADAQGAHIIVRTGNTYLVYAHLDPSSIRVGTHVEAGQVIGRIEGNHLHFETRTHGANVVEIDRHTGDYIPEDPNAPLLLDKPLLLVDPKLYFNPELASAIDHGIA